MIDSMRNNVYLDFIRKSFMQRFAYRTNSYISIVSSLLRLSIMLSVWYALLGNGKSINDISYEDMIQFVIINLVISSMISSQIGNQLARKIEDGSIAIDFIRPVRLKYYLIAEQLGENSFRTLFNTLPVCIVAILFLQFRFPDEPWQIGMFLLSLLLGMAIIYQINFTIGLLAFWFKTSFYTNWFLGAFMELFAGTFVPLWFYPEPLYAIAHYLPFHLISFQPLSIYLGKLTLSASIQIIGLQMMWIVLLIVLEKWMWKRVQNKVIVQGG